MNSAIITLDFIKNSQLLVFITTCKVQTQLTRLIAEKFHICTIYSNVIRRISLWTPVGLGKQKVPTLRHAIFTCNTVFLVDSNSSFTWNTATLKSRNAKSETQRPSSRELPLPIADYMLQQLQLNACPWQSIRWMSKQYLSCSARKM